jgi:hypothetical protein
MPYVQGSNSQAKAEPTPKPAKLTSAKAKEEASEDKCCSETAVEGLRDEPGIDTQGPVADTLADAIDSGDSFEQMCKEIFEETPDQEQQDQRAQKKRRKKHKDEVRRQPREQRQRQPQAIGSGPIRTASSTVGAVYDDTAPVPYGASRAKLFMQRAAASAAAIGKPPIGKPPQA